MPYVESIVEDLKWACERLGGRVREETEVSFVCDIDGSRFVVSAPSLDYPDVAFVSSDGNLRVGVRRVYDVSCDQDGRVTTCHFRAVSLKEDLAVFVSGGRLGVSVSSPEMSVVCREKQ